jgi:uncharacterized membrane protein
LAGEKQMTTVKTSSEISINPSEARFGHHTVRIDNLDPNSSLAEPIEVEFRPNKGNNEIIKERCPILEGPRTVTLDIFIAPNASPKQYRVIVTAPGFSGETDFKVTN